MSFGNRLITGRSFYAALLLALGVLMGLALVGLLAVSPVLAGAPSGSAPIKANGVAATATPGCTLAPWEVVANPRLNGRAGFQDVVAVSPTSAWAIGNYINGDESRGLIEHWDGERWNIVPGQSNFAGYYLVAVDALSDSDIWVAGQANGSLILHWDGVSWTRVPSPNTGFTYLTDIDAISTNDVWAVGYYSDGSTGHNLTMHWDGTQWTIISAPEPFSSHHYLYSVSGTSATDVWAVGEASQNQDSVAIHWDGQQWSHVPTPLTGRGGNTLFTVAAISPNDAWAMGHAQYGPTAVILHWDGKSWNPATTPEVLGAPRSMAVISADDIWAVGTNGYQGGGARIAHWDGVAWRSVPAPPNLMDATLFEVSGTAGGPVWAVGDHSLNPGDQPLTLRYDHKPCGAPTRTPTPTGVATPAPPICGVESNYEIEHGTGASIVPGVILVPGSQCNDCLASVNLPFTYYLYGQPHDTAQVGSNGVLNFTGNQNDPFNECAPDPGSDAAIFPFWDNLDTSASVNPTYGVYTSLTGLAPNRIFNIEWRSCRWREGACNAFVNFEVRLYEGQNKFDVIYGSSGDVHGTASAGVQRDGEGTLYTNYYCAISHIPPGTRLTYFQPICNTPTPSVTGTPPTATPTHTAIPTGTRTPTQTPTITPTGTPGCGLLWRQVSVPDPGSVENALYGLAAISSQEMWAVGTYRTGSSAYQALLMRWSGDAWAHYPSPSSRNNVLRGVASLSPTDAWAVGYSYLSTGPAQTLIKHWNGSAWTNIPSPSPGEASALYGVTAIATNDVWAVGYQQINSRHQTLILHWNGQQWTTVASPNPGSGNNDLNGITAISSSDVWAVGSYAETGSFEGTLTLHWNGSQWTHVPSPNLIQSPLYAVAALFSDNVWAVGTRNLREDSLIMRWDGSQWSQVTSADAGDHDRLYGIVALSKTDIWAVGESYLPSSGSSRAVIQHWDGLTWSLVPAPDPEPAYDVIYGAAAMSPQDVWVGGYSGTVDFQLQSLAMRYSDSCVTATPTATGTRTTPTRMPSNTPTATACVPGWSVVPHATPWGMSGKLASVEGVSEDDIWAVGSHTIEDSPVRTLAEHWDGTRWSIVSSPNPGPFYNYLNGVAVVAANDVWAVGHYADANNVGRTLVQHWNGSQWTVVPSPNMGVRHNFLLSVSARAADDVWAVGYYVDDSNAEMTLVEHWNGSAWSVIPSPGGAGTYSRLNSVTAISSNDAWAVGSTIGGQSPFALHWNGSSWATSAIPLPPSALSAALLGVTAVSASDVWAVGWYYTGTGGIKTLIMHWNGSTWSVVSSPDLGNAAHSLSAVRGISPDDVWAVGSFQGRTLVEHWNGSTWSVVSSPSTGSKGAQFTSVAPVSSNVVWAVGGMYYSPNYQTLIERYIGNCSAPVPTATSMPVLPTFTPVVPTVTAIGLTPTMPPLTHTAVASSTATSQATPATAQPTGTNLPGATATSTAAMASVTSLPTLTTCAISFSDVPEGSTFYPYVRCLACRNVLGGYTDGTFRPNANVTRGQLSKIVANSAGFSEPASGQTFQDVSASNSFYVYVERMSARGIIGGYPCGGTGEPCGSGNRPYFRPNANATRGQISKIVSEAKGYSDPQTGQTFQDVAVGSTFHLWIERLASRGIMGGYPCGGTGEPCGAGNRPYFRPNANATRGQISKIVSEARGYSEPQTGQTFEDVVGSTFHLWIERLASRGIMGGYPCGGTGEPCGSGNKPYFRPYNNATRGQVSKIVSGTFYPACSPVR